jgi:septum formation protein
VQNKSLILASSSQSRLKILTGAGLDVIAVKPKCDEEALKNQLLDQGLHFQALSERLAEEKAQKISEENPDAYVIGGDQILLCGEHMFSKALDINDAREHLRFFRGQSHMLITSIALLKAGKLIWSFTDLPELTMRVFSDSFLEEYLATNSAAIQNAVGCYYLEERGIELFEKIEGDFYSILGLPLLPLLKKLRELEVCPT